MEIQQPKSVIIIGGGLAGLTAAQQILKAEPKAKVTVLQAMSEVGGRTRSKLINGAIYDLGAEWVGNPQKYALALAERAKNECEPQYEKGTKILQLGLQTQNYETDIPQGVGYLQLIHMQIIMWKVDRLAKTVPLDNPRDCPNAFEWDSMTFHTWVEQNVWFDKVRRLFELSVRSIIGCETNEISFLFFLWYVRQNHGLDCLVQIENGLQARKFVKGTQYLSKFLVKSIQGFGGKVLCNSFVSKVIQNQTQVTVYTRNGEQYKANYLIFAGPPPAARNIEFQPQLSRERRLINNRYIMGGYSKMILLYDKAYWREKQFSGQILSDCHDSPVLMTYDDTRMKQNGEIQAAIVVFFGAGIDEQWTGDKEKCKRSVAQKLAYFFKCHEMLNPIAVEMKVWNQEESLGGAPTAYAPPGLLTKISSLRHVQGLIHWAGTQTASISQGYMDGAIESGIRVSKQIIGRFNNSFIPIPRQQPSSKWYSMITGFKRPGFLQRLRFW